MKQIIIAIALYNPLPSREELSAFEQALIVFKDRPFSFFCPPSLDLNSYMVILNKYQIIYTITHWNEKFFRGREGYNKLLLSTAFYKSYSEYEYLLISQLDVWAIRDDLDFWCTKGYDYIGAPFLVLGELDTAKSGSPDDYPGGVFRVGNGGFSLRKVSAMIDVLGKAHRSLHPVRSWSFLKSFFKGRFYSQLPLMVLRYIRPSNFLFLHHLHPLCEDQIFSLVLAGLYQLKVPSPSQAAGFALDTFPSWIVERQREYPMAWHAYLKYEPEFFQISLSNSFQIKKQDPPGHPLSGSILPVLVLYKRSLNDSVTYQTLLSKYSGVIFVYDNSPDAHKLDQENVIYVHDPTNSGVSKAYNMAAAYAREHGLKWLLLLDQDTAFPENALEKYQNAFFCSPACKLFAPLLAVGDDIPFSPARYLRKRARKIRLELGRCYPIPQISPVNSGMMVHVDSFLAAGGYNEKVWLDLSDFVFLESMSHVTDHFYLIPLKLHQSYGEEAPSAESDLSRFKIYLDCLRNAPRRNLLDGFWYWRTGLRRAFSFTLRHRKFIFLKEFFS